MNILDDLQIKRSLMIAVFFLAVVFQGMATPPSGAGEDRNLCFGDCTVLGSDTAMVGFSYSWTSLAGASNASLNDTSLAQPMACPGTTTIYQVVEFDSTLMVSDTDTVVIVITNDFTLTTAFTQEIICLGEDVQFDTEVTPPSPNYVFSWTNPGNNNTYDNENIADPLGSPVTTAVHNLTVVDTFTNCTDEVNVTVVVDPLPVLVTPVTQQINPGQSVQLTAQALQAMEPVTYSWSPSTYMNCPNCQNPEVRPSETTQYTVTATDDRGCMGSASLQISVDSLSIPNVFSPNNDGINDVLFLNYYGTGDYEILIYDRWGTEIFATQNSQVFWDGMTKNGTIAPEGVYYMYVRIQGDIAIPEKDKQRAFAINLVR